MTEHMAPGDCDLVLASASPRRNEILQQLGVAFSVVPAEIDESPKTEEAPDVYVRRLALYKAEAVSAKHRHSIPVLAADTTVTIDRLILGKPCAIEQAREMLSRLSGRWHEVHSGLAIMHRGVTVKSVRTRVKFRDIEPVEIDRYWESGEPQDKAGAYAIQGLGGAFVERIDGSYSNVVGLPMVETIALLDEYKVAYALKPKIGSTRP